MAFAAPDREERRQFSRRWTRRLVLLAILCGLGWMALTGYYFRWDLMIGSRILWDNRAYVLLEYAPGLLDTVDRPPPATLSESVLRGKVARPIDAPITVADVLIGNAVNQLKEILPLVVFPALLVMVGGGLLGWLCGRMLRLVYPEEFRRIWPAIVVPAALAFGAGSVFGVAAFYFKDQIFRVLGL